MFECVCPCYPDNHLCVVAEILSRAVRICIWGAQNDVRMTIFQAAKMELGGFFLESNSHLKYHERHRPPITAVCTKDCSAQREIKTRSQPMSGLIASRDFFHYFLLHTFASQSLSSIDSYNGIIYMLVMSITKRHFQKNTRRISRSLQLVFKILQCRL